MKRKICFITGSRAEYGLLRSIIIKSSKSKEVQTQVIVTGSHLSKKHGMTINEIKEDKIKINSMIDLKLTDDKSLDIIYSLSRGMKLFGRELAKLNPDLVVILGDRSEIFAAATSAMILGVPIAHIHGGEITTGAYDDSMRHAITKLSSIHFVAANDYRKRVIQLGENPKTVFNVGGLGVDAINNITLLSRISLERKFNFKFCERNLLVCFHPETMLKAEKNNKIFYELLEALKSVKSTSIIFTMPNADVGNQAIIDMIQGFVQKHSFAFAFESLGQQNFLSMLKYVDGILGNSSSGILEAPSFGTITINIGNRQTGRIKADSVIDCKPQRKDIDRAIQSIYSKRYLEISKKVKNPYKNGATSTKIFKKLVNFPLKNVQPKCFYDLS
jgi:GDP/UDP-N,N'-diacetylbacillosamine 2-epimerase (hydrolysing)